MLGECQNMEDPVTAVSAQFAIIKIDHWGAQRGTDRYREAQRGTERYRGAHSTERHGEAQRCTEGSTDISLESHRGGHNIKRDLTESSTIWIRFIRIGVNWNTNEDCVRMQQQMLVSRWVNKENHFFVFGIQSLESGWFKTSRVHLSSIYKTV